MVKILMIMNALNDIWSDIYILQVNISKNYKSRQKFAKRLGFKDIKFPLKKKNFIGICIFGYENSKISNLSIKKMLWKNTCWFIIYSRKRQKVLCFYQRFFNIFMHDHILYRGRKHFFRYCLQGFSAEEILKRHIKDGKVMA